MNELASTIVTYFFSSLKTVSLCSHEWCSHLCSCLRCNLIQCSANFTAQPTKSQMDTAEPMWGCTTNALNKFKTFNWNISALSDPSGSSREGFSNVKVTTQMNVMSLDARIRTRCYKIFPNIIKHRVIILSLFLRIDEDKCHCPSLTLRHSRWRTL